MRWVTVDTRRLDTIQGIVDGFIHIMPRSHMHKHWVQIDCWCDPVAAWHSPAGTVIVEHNHRAYPHDTERTELHA